MLPKRRDWPSLKTGSGYPGAPGQNHCRDVSVLKVLELAASWSERAEEYAGPCAGDGTKLDAGCDIAEDDGE